MPQPDARTPQPKSREEAPAAADDDEAPKNRKVGRLEAKKPPPPQPFTFADGTRIVPEGPFDTDDAQYLIEAGLEGAGITQFMRLAIENDLAAGRLRTVLPEIPLFTTPVYVLHPFGRQLPLRARLFIDFLVETLGVGNGPNLSSQS